MNAMKLALIVIILVFAMVGFESARAATTGGDVTVHTRPLTRNVHIQILGGDGNLILEGNTDVNGQFIFTDVPISSAVYRVMVSDPNYRPYTANLTVSSISSYSVDLNCVYPPPQYDMPGSKHVPVCGAVIFASVGIISFMFIVRIKKDGPQ